jgi:hypothetical protein
VLGDTVDRSHSANAIKEQSYSLASLTRELKTRLRVEVPVGVTHVEQS